MANTCNTSLNSNIQQIRSDLTQGLTDNSPGLWITSIDISQVIDAQFPDLSKYLTPPVENTREIVNFTVNNTARVSSISSFHHLSSPSRESLNAQIYDSLAVPIRKLAKDVEEVLNLALPSETLELSLLQFSRECG
ncbi:MAG: hypothetical protein KDD40_00515, partial [Bdellovibrionales bacterium]|nr:hypothetical protein [Bdellovibrionales bacterium]